ncbi:MAG TPA: FAD-dependent oxidoreductase, partial [Devosia sp.]|nr:FAD-dependent oxidoreductase [Devosia sp.]
MKGQPHRLYSHLPLGGTALDRRLPLKFRLDGRLIHGFDGDTVLSAVLAAGIDTLGEYRHSPIALTLRNAPAILPRRAGKDLPQALPMARTPATNGAEYTTLGPRNSGPLSRWFSRLTGARRSLGLTLDRPLPRPWREQAGEPGPTCAVLVVGGGVSGMTAALSAAKAGKKVVLVEALPRLGGHARLFGSVDGEEAPEASIARLTAAIAATDAITVLTRAEAFAIRPGLVRVHVVEHINGALTPRTLDLHAQNIILATGTLERLPVFAGNRLPGIVGALEAFHLAHQYGVWPGRSALFATVSSPVYRLAMQAMDSGIAVPRILDDRPDPNSRFIEFAKAYGMTQAPGTLPAAATQADDQLTITPRLDLGEFSHQEPDLSIDRLGACGGWQPDLQLWHMAGGTSAWNTPTAQLQARSGPAGIALAGSAAGYRSHQAVMASGVDAVAQVLGRKRRPVAETPVDPFYETPDAPTPLAPTPDATAAPAFFDHGTSYLTAPRPPRRTLW